MKTHSYTLELIWTGNKGMGTASYQSYERSHQINAAGKPILQCSSDSIFRGDAAKYNPEELLLAAISGCHLLMYLHLCTDHGIVVNSYQDHCECVLVLDSSGGGRIISATLKPVIIIAEISDRQKAAALHADANKLCFIANSLNFPITHFPEIKLQSGD